ncbi:MAG: flagellar hook-length control protein FliK [Phycisphaeraceae bacterium]
MSIGSLNPTKTTSADLFAALPASAEPRFDRSRDAGVGDKNKPPFSEVLRESSSADRSGNASDHAAKSNTNQSDPIDRTDASAAVSADDGVTASDGESASEQQSADDVAQSGNDNGGDNAASETTDSDGSETQAAETADADAEALANAAAQAALAQATAGSTSTAATEAAIDARAAEASTATKISGEQQAQTSTQAQAVASQVKSNGQPTGTTATTGQATGSAAAVAIQPGALPGESSQSGHGESRGDTKAGTTAQLAATSNTAAPAQAQTAFALSDQAGAESRLPLNPAPIGVTPDAAKLAQAQPLNATADNEAVNTSRLTRGLASAVQQRGGAVTLRLTPPEMGTVRIQMQITGTSVSAAFHAESTSAQTLLTNQLAQLRSSLESKGMSVERLSVQPLAASASTSSANQSQSQQQGDASQHNGSQQQSANDGRSRGQYTGDSPGRETEQDADRRGQSQARRGFQDRLADLAEQSTD